MKIKGQGRKRMVQEDKKQRLLDTAVTLMAKKVGKDLTNADIAGLAGLNESIIYHYFKNKTDLLFYAAGESIKKHIAELEWHLKGIREPISRLSKLIWFQLQYHDDEPEYAKFTIFECRSNRDFFGHEALIHFVRWVNILRDILRSGVDEGYFSKDLNVPVACEMITGLLDMENIEFFAGRRKDSVQNDLETIMDMILPMLSWQTTGKKKHGAKRTAILHRAEEIFAQKGYEKATTLEIARSAKVAEGTLYEYFKGKEDILFSLLRHRFQEHLSSRNEALSSPVIRLQQFIQDFFLMFLLNQAFAMTFISEGIYNERFYQSDAYEDFEIYLKTIDTILDEGEKTGSIRIGVDKRIFKNLFIGAFSNLMLRWMHPCRELQLDLTGESINDAVTLLLRTVILPEEKQP